MKQTVIRSALLSTIAMFGVAIPSFATDAWITERMEAENALHLADLSKNAKAGKPLTVNDKDRKLARAHWLKAVDDLEKLPVSKDRKAMADELNKLLGVISVSIAMDRKEEVSKIPESAADKRKAYLMTNAKTTYGDFQRLIPIMEKQLGANAPELVNLKKSQAKLAVALDGGH